MGAVLGLAGARTVGGPKRWQKRLGTVTGGWKRDCRAICLKSSLNAVVILPAPKGGERGMGGGLRPPRTRWDFQYLRGVTRAA